MIESTFMKLLAKYRVKPNSAKRFWSEIESKYSKSNRHYHNLQHLEDLLQQLKNVKDRIENWTVILFTLYYHDIIYKSIKKDNEEKSATLASKRLYEIGVTENDINLCYEQIIATKSHNISDNSDTNYFTDADLSILGREPNKYKDYCQDIRKEYAVFPNFFYRRGRKKVINHFLSMKRIFKTDEFYSQYENKARENLREELILLK